jgi:hypothetical protein
VQKYKTIWNFGAMMALKVQKAGEDASFCHPRPLYGFLFRFKT